MGGNVLATEQPLGECAITAAPLSGGLDFRTTLGHFASGIAIIAASHEGSAVGLSVQSFASLSLDPRLVSFSVSLTSKTWPRIQSVGRFCASVLAADQEALCRQFARSGTDKFQGVEWTLSPATASPLINGALAWVDCEIADLYPAGDHWLVVAEVLDLGLSAEGTLPLLFFKGQFSTLT
ncbi:MAG: NADPH-flavin oxidoreductase [Pseudonocardiales bacterium]|nr:NADPH-flavin oxidoreductase [Pseudonocardiales bacterium]